MQPKARLLVVDDIEDNRSVLTRRLTRRGFEVTEASGGKAALDLLSREAFDLVLLDVMMPDLDGFSVLRTARQQHTPSTLPVIMVTANDQSDGIVEALEAGANDYLTKPVDFPVALARIQTQLARKQAEEALHRANAELEQRVAERTALLTEANHQLGLEILERSRTEQDLRAANKAAETASRAKTGFLASVSHELRTPLHAIIGFSELLRDRDVGKAVTAEDREYAAAVIDSGRELLDLIDKVLMFANTEAGTTRLTDGLSELEGLIRKAVKRTETAAEQRSIRLETQLPAHQTLVRVDDALFRTALGHILSNAVKFNKEGGRVVLSAALDPDGSLAITCADTGIGLAADELKTILTPFSQADVALSRRYGGLGIGLPLARALVELHEGTLTVDSVQGQGTTVTVRLPASRIAAMPALSAAS